MVSNEGEVSVTTSTEKRGCREGAESVRECTDASSSVRREKRVD